MSKKGQLWSAEEIEALKSMVNNSASLDEIVAALDRTPYGVIGKMHSLGWLFMRGNAYYLVAPDPWTMVPMVKDLQERFLKAENNAAP